MRQPVSVVDAYNTGHTVFMGMNFLVGPGVLVPRRETELLGATAVGVLGAMDLLAPYVVDMCCGAANLACAIARHVPNSRVWASDLTDGSVDAARRNVAHHGLAERVSVVQGDLFGGLLGLRLENSIDVIVCNPPYISERRLEGERAELLDLEPREAFAAGPYGISLHMRVVKDAPRYLRQGGILLFEVGLGQDRQVMTLLERSKAFGDIRAVSNELGERRVVLGQVIALEGSFRGHV